MNILILNWKDIKNPEAGGAEVIAFELAKRLVNEKNNVTFFSRKFDKSKKEENIDGVKIIRRGNRLTVYVYAFLFYKKLKIKPDRVIDMVNTLSWQTPLYVSKDKRIVYFNQLAREVFFFEIPKPFSIIPYMLEKIQYLFYKNTKCLCYSNSTKEDLVSFGFKRENVNVFPMGLDHSRYGTAEGKEKTPFFIFVARLVKMKRADLCVKAMAIVVKKYNQAKLAVIGSGPDEERIKKIIKKLKLEKNVFLINKNNFFMYKNIKDVKIKYMQTAWGLLLPSVKEGWGMVVTEAGACGTPSIVSNVTGLKDSVIHNKTGIRLSKNPTTKELSDAIIKLIEEKSLRKKFSKESIKFSNKFSWEKSFKIFYKYISESI